jgi:hypothetical protein
MDHSLEYIHQGHNSSVAKCVRILTLLRFLNFNHLKFLEETFISTLKNIHVWIVQVRVCADVDVTIMVSQMKSPSYLFDFSFSNYDQNELVLTS